MINSALDQNEDEMVGRHNFPLDYKGFDRKRLLPRETQNESKRDRPILNPELSPIISWICSISENPQQFHLLYNHELKE